MGGLTRSTRISMFSVCEHYAVYVSTIGSCMPSCRLRRLAVPLLHIVHIDFTETHAQSRPKGNKILISPHFRHSGLHGFLGGLTMTYYVICYSRCMHSDERTGHAWRLYQYMHQVCHLMCAKASNLYSMQLLSLT